MAKFVNQYYENSHGKSPRGRGQWAFVGLYGVNEFGWVSDETYVYIDEPLTLTEAKREVVRMFPGVKAWAVAP